MAKTAKAGESIPAQNGSPDYEKVIGMIRTRYPGLKEKANSANGEIGVLMKSIENDYNVNKRAAAMFITIDRMADERRADVVRGLIQMLTLGGHMPEADLVDMAQGGGDDPDGDEPTPDRGDGDEFDAAAPKASKGKVVDLRPGTPGKRAAADDEFGVAVNKMLDGGVKAGKPGKAEAPAAETKH